MSYQQESLAAGATHVGEKGHGWRVCPKNGNWQTFKLGSGWVNSAPTSKLTELYNSIPPESAEPIPSHYINLVQSWSCVRRAVALVRERPCEENIKLLCEIAETHNELMESR